MLRPSEVQDVFQQNEDENYTFRLYLKGHAEPEELDEHFLRLHNEIFDTYDCSQCRNCCKLFSTQFEHDEIKPAAELLQLSKKEFISQYLIEEDGDYTVDALPCTFLCEDNSCKLGECRPSGCKEFPFTNLPNRLFSLHSFLASASICPAAYEILERLKPIYRFNWKKV